jgi:hypothetical protein
MRLVRTPTSRIITIKRFFNQPSSAIYITAKPYFPHLASSFHFFPKDSKRFSKIPLIEHNSLIKESMVLNRVSNVLKIENPHRPV